MVVANSVAALAEIQEVREHSPLGHIGEGSASRGGRRYSGNEPGGLSYLSVGRGCAEATVRLCGTKLSVVPQNGAQAELGMCCT